MPYASPNAQLGERRTRGTRLGFRLDAETKGLVERAAALERRSVTDFCLAALVEASRVAIAREETLALSERDRAAFFDMLVQPPQPHERLRRAFQSAEERVVAR